VGRVFAFGKHHFGHTAPDVPAKVHTGKVPDAIETQPFNGFCCSIGIQFPAFVLVEQVLQWLVYWHDCNNTDMEQRIIS